MQTKPKKKLYTLKNQPIISILKVTNNKYILLINFHKQWFHQVKRMGKLIIQSSFIKHLTHTIEIIMYIYRNFLHKVAEQITQQYFKLY